MSGTICCAFRDGGCRRALRPNPLHSAPMWSVCHTRVTVAAARPVPNGSVRIRRSALESWLEEREVAA